MRDKHTLSQMNAHLLLILSHQRIGSNEMLFLYYNFYNTLSYHILQYCSKLYWYELNVHRIKMELQPGHHSTSLNMSEDHYFDPLIALPMRWQVRTTNLGKKFLMLIVSMKLNQVCFALLFSTVLCYVVLWYDGMCCVAWCYAMLWYH